MFQLQEELFNNKAEELNSNFEKLVEENDINDKIREEK